MNTKRNIRICRIVPFVLWACVLLMQGSFVLAGTDTVRVETHVANSEDRMSITDVCEMHGEWIVGYQNGKVAAKNQVTGTDTWSVTIPLSRQVSTILSDETLNAIVALCNDGTLFIVDSEHRTEQIPTDSLKVSTIVKAGSKFLALDTTGLFTIDIQSRSLIPVEILGGMQYSRSIRETRNGDLLVGSSLGTLYTLRKNQQDGYIKLDSVFTQAGSLEEIVILGDGYLTKGGNGQIYLVTKQGIADLWRPTFVTEQYANPAFVHLAVRDIFTNDSSTRMLLKSWSIVGDNPILTFVIEYDIEADTFTVIRKYDGIQPYNQRAYAFTDSTQMMGGTLGFFECTYKGEQVAGIARRPSSWPDWDCYRIYRDKIFTAKANVDSSITTATSANGRTWQNVDDWLLTSDVYGVNDIVPDEHGVLALTVSMPTYLVTEGHRIEQCEIPFNNLRSGWGTDSPNVYWLVSNEGPGRYIRDQCTYVSSKPPAFIDRQVSVMNDSVAYITDIAGKVYHVRVDADSLVYKKIEGDIPIGGSQSVIGVYNGLTYCYTNNRSGQNVLISGYNEYGQLVNETDIRWADLHVSNWGSFFSNHDLITFDNLTNTISTLDLYNKTISRAFVVPLGVPLNSQLTLLGITAQHAVFKVGVDRIAMLPLQTIVGVEDYPVKSVYFTNVFPNPGSDYLTIQLGRNVTADIGRSTLLITSVLGNIERRFDLDSLWPNSEFSAVVQVQVSDLPCGPHLLVIQNRGYTESTLLNIVR